MIKLPLTKRQTGGEQIQLWLTPEQRYGDFIRFTFKLVTRSMSRLDPTIRSKRIVEFGVNIVPALLNAANIALQMGVRFNPQRAITDLANELDIFEQIEDWFDDPEFEQKMALIAKLGPQDAGKAGMMSSEGIMQNQGFPGKRDVLGPRQEANQFAQETAAESQSANQGVY